VVMNEAVQFVRSLRGAQAAGQEKNSLKPAFPLVTVRIGSNSGGRTESAFGQVQLRWGGLNLRAREPQATIAHPGAKGPQDQRASPIGAPKGARANTLANLHRPFLASPRCVRGRVEPQLNRSRESSFQRITYSCRRHCYPMYTYLVPLRSSSCSRVPFVVHILSLQSSI
jgi:hypothetical protein